MIEKGHRPEENVYAAFGQTAAGRYLAVFFVHKTEPVEFEVNIQSEARYYPLEISLEARLVQIARQRGVSVETLLNLWVQEKLQESQLAPS